MIKSMTGFGRGENAGRYKHVTAEIKSVNHRYSEIMVKLPRQYSFLEDNIRRHTLEEISRGRVEIYLKLEDNALWKRQVQVDKELAVAYHNALKDLAYITETDLSVGAKEIALFPDVLTLEEPQENLEEIWEDILPAVDKALKALLQMRLDEGSKLKTDLLDRLDYISSLHKKVEEKSPLVVNQYKEKLQARMKELLDGAQIDETRIAVEVAMFADRCSIAEETVRLNSHIGQFHKILAEKNPIGRKLDFLLQEMNREINTIGSKANDLEITQHVVEMKSELEKLREQVQNIE